jgi:selenocysteine lyase/cysteine desulfurase
MGAMLTCLRHEFRLPRDVHYLNCAYMSPLSNRVVAAGRAGVLRKAEPYRIATADFFEESDRARGLFARLIGVDASRVALVPAASYGLAVIARNTAVSPGHNVVVAHEQFPSNVYPWRGLCARHGATLRTVAAGVAGPGRARDWNVRLLEAIDRRTTLVALGHVHWADGTRFDLEVIARRAREVGAAVVIDGTQSLGALPFDAGRIRPDAVVCAGYKWLMAPYSTGFAYFGPRYEEAEPLEETWAGRLGSDDFAGLVRYRDEYLPGAARFDVGERANFALQPMLVAAMEQVLEWDAGAIQDYCRALTRELLGEVSPLGFDIEEEGGRASHLFGLRMPPGLDPRAAADQLRERRVHVSIRGSSVRVSPHVYNDERDVGALIEALRAIAAPARR